MVEQASNGEYGAEHQERVAGQLALASSRHSQGKRRASVERCQR